MDGQTCQSIVKGPLSCYAFLSITNVFKIWNVLANPMNGDLGQSHKMSGQCIISSRCQTQLFH